MNCSKCNAQIPEGSAFCQNCGAPVNQQPAEQPQQAPVYTPPVEETQQQEPVYTPPVEETQQQEPVYTPPVEQVPQQAPVYTPPVEQVPQQEPVYTPPVEQAPQQAPVYTPPVEQAPQQAPAYAPPVQQAPVYNPVAAPMAPAPKKKSKAWIAIPIVLAVIVVVAIIAVVSGGSPKDKVVGEWTASIDFSDYFVNLIEDDSDYEILTKYIDEEEFEGVLEYDFVFNEDDTVTVTITQDSYNAFVDSYAEMLQKAVVGYVRDVYGEYADDMSDEEIIAYFEFDTLAQEIKENEEYSAEELNDFADFATYTIDKETITFYANAEAGGYYYDSTYEINGDTMTISFDEGLFDNDDLIPYFQNITLVKD